MARDEPSRAGGEPPSTTATDGAQVQVTTSTPTPTPAAALSAAPPVASPATAADLLLQPLLEPAQDPIPERPHAPPPLDGYAGVSLVAENTVPRVDPRCSYLLNAACCPEEITAGFYVCMYCSRMLWPPMPGTCVVAPWEPVGQSW